MGDDREDMEMTLLQKVKLKIKWNSFFIPKYSDMMIINTQHFISGRQIHLHHQGQLRPREDHVCQEQTGQQHVLRWDGNKKMKGCVIWFGLNCAGSRGVEMKHREMNHQEMMLLQMSRELVIGKVIYTVHRRKSMKNLKPQYVALLPIQNTII